MLKLPPPILPRIAFVRASSAASTPLAAGAARAAAAAAVVEELVLPPPGAHLARFDVEPLLRWAAPRGAARGLVNHGNTCFFNATLQCLAATPALAQHLARGEHKPRCAASAAGAPFCALCAAETLIGGSMYRGVALGAARPPPLDPNKLVSNVRALGRQFRNGRQEDAHELLRCLLEHMHAATLRDAGVSEKAPGRLAETTAVHRLFGGYFRNQLHCPACGFDANSYEPFLDVSLEVGGALKSVDAALRAFVAPERLDEANTWKCPKCARAVRAVKQLTIKAAPPVLTVHLKRFSFSPAALLGKNASLAGVRAAAAGGGFGARGFFGGGGGGGKIGAHIAFPLVLDLAPALSDAAAAAGARGAAPPPPYDLHGVLVHQGASAHSGHYFAFVKDGSGAWVKMNDERVDRVAEADVLAQPAYMLFYSRRAAARPAPRAAAAPAAAPATAPAAAAPAAPALSALSASPPSAAAAAATDAAGAAAAGAGSSSSAASCAASARA